MDETNITLPDGSTWLSGAELRDSFHLTDYAAADLLLNLILFLIQLCHVVPYTCIWRSYSIDYSRNMFVIGNDQFFYGKNMKIYIYNLHALLFANYVFLSVFFNGCLIDFLISCKIRGCP